MSDQEWEFKEYKRAGRVDRLAILNKKYNLSKSSDLELVMAMKTLCNEYMMCQYTYSPGLDDVWNSIVRIAKEIIRR